MNTKLLTNEIYGFISLKDPNFCVMDIDDVDDPPILIKKVSELRKLNEDYIEVPVKNCFLKKSNITVLWRIMILLFNLQHEVVCELIIKKVDDSMNWYIPYCTNCDIELSNIDKKYQCPNSKCGRICPYPDRRLEIITHFS